MKKYITILFAIIFLAGGWAPQAGAALNAVGPVNLANGYPFWYEDTNLLRLEPCLDQNGMCLAVAPFPGAIAFPANFPDEFFYWSAVALIDDAASATISSIPVLLVLALEGAFAIGPVQDTQQVVFARIRYRFTPTVTGNYTLTHPFGTITVAGTAGTVATATQDIGLAPLVFTGALADGPPGGGVNADGRSIGPFLTPADGSRQVVGGFTYLANPNLPIAVTGSPLGINSFTIVGPPGTGTATTALFALEGKVSGCVAGNTAPTAVVDFGAVATGQPQIIPLTANDTPGTVGLVPINPGGIAVTTQPLAAEGTVAKNLDGTVTYTPAANFSGNSSFAYTVQDNCGLISAPMTVPVVVEQLVANKAEFRARTGKWTITGTSSHNAVTLPPPAGDGVTATPNVVTLHKGTPTGPVVGTATVSNGTWKFVGPSKIPPGAAPENIHVESSATVKITKPLQRK